MLYKLKPLLMFVKKVCFQFFYSKLNGVKARTYTKKTLACRSTVSNWLSRSLLRQWPDPFYRGPLMKMLEIRTARCRATFKTLKTTAHKLTCRCPFYYLFVWFSSVEEAQRRSWNVHVLKIERRYLSHVKYDYTKTKTNIKAR